MSIAIIGAYAPSETRQKRENGEIIEQKYTMWNIQQGKMKGIPQADRQDDPTHQFMFDLMTQIAKLKAMNFEVILAGDFNLNWKTKSPKVRLWKDLIQNQDLVNIIEKWWDDETHKIHTYKQNETKTWIDYHLMSSTLLLRGAGRRAGIEQGQLSYTSDHMLTAVEMNFTKALGRLQGQPVLYQPRTRSLMSTIPEHREMYQTAMRDLLKTEFTDIKAQTSHITGLARTQRRNGSKADRTKLLKKMDTLMQQLTKLMLQSEDKMEVQKRKFKGKNKRDVWSTFWATKSRYMTLLKRIIACAAVKRDRHKVRKLLRQLKPDNDTHLQYGLDELPQVPETAAPHAEWRQYRQKATEMIRTKQQRLHLRDRRKARLNMKKALAIRDKQMRNQREVGQWIKWALKRTPRESKPTVLLQETDKGITVTDTPKAMSVLERKLTKEAHGI